jgi:hypothetical protein
MTISMLFAEGSTMDKQYQYLLFAAEPYEIIAFKVSSTLISSN